MRFIPVALLFALSLPSVRLDAGCEITVGEVTFLLHQPPHPKMAAQLQDMFTSNGWVPEMGKVKKPKSNVQDTEFADFAIAGRDFKYQDIGPEAGNRTMDALLFYGKKSGSLQQAEGDILAMFANGRTRSNPNMHRDIDKHQDSTKNDPSAFVQTSTDYNVSNRFTGSLGVIFIIDGHGAPLLDINALRAKFALGTRFESEKEILFDRTLAPDRIIGAIVQRQPNGYNTAVKVLLNPYYRYAN